MIVSEAAEIGDVEQLRALLEAGGDPNEPETEQHGLPLLEAASNDHNVVSSVWLIHTNRS